MAISKGALRFIAGETLLSAIKRIKVANKRHMRGIIDYLGEELHTKKEVKIAISRYIKTMDEIAKRNLKAEIDVKLTNLGLVISKDYCKKNLIKILKHAKKHNYEIWIDAEQFKYWDDTLDIYLSVLKSYPNTFITLQSYLINSDKYIKRILSKRGKVRLVKGTYFEDKSVALQKRTQIRKQYVKLMNTLFTKSNNFGIATHDELIINKALKLQDKYNRDIEFQFLMGLAYNIKIKLAKQGYKVGEYIPYGKKWKKYYKRRLMYLKEIKYL